MSVRESDSVPASSEISPVEALTRQRLGAVLIDVREPGEWALGSPLDALRVPLARIEADPSALELDQGTPVVAICASGRRSLRAIERLRAVGFRRLASVAGGFVRWKREGLPFEIVSALDADARARYSRHLLLPEVGEAGQLRLGKARVLLVGAGGLGSPAALYLAAAGIGHLRLVDHDRVELSNLQRQVLHGDDRLGELKVDSARRTLATLNPRCRVETLAERVDASNAAALLDGVDVVVDGTDNFAARYALDAACVAAGKPLVYGAIHRFEAQVSVFWSAAPSAGPCYRCLFPFPPAPEDAPNCAEAGVLGVLPGIVGCVQATEALKLVLGIGTPLLGRLLQFDALAMRWREIALTRDPQCPGCGPLALRVPATAAPAQCASGVE